jgi:hypothetical protein
VADKDFKVKNKLFVNGLSHNSGVILATNNNLDSHTNVPTQYGGTGTTQSPNAGQVLYSAAGTNYAPTTLSSLIQGSSYQADAPSSPDVGDIWIESDSSADSFDPNIIRRHTFTATAAQTNFVASVNFVDGYEQVYFNGLLLLKTTDYTTSGNNTVTLTSAAAAGDIVEIVTVTNLNSTNTYTQSEINNIVDTQINNLIANAPAALNTLDELALALGDDANFATTVTNSLAGKKNETFSSIVANTNLAAGTRYFVTSASALTLTLPSSPSVNDQIDVFDASGNASTYNITVARNGKLINGNAGNFIIDVNGSWYTLVFTGNTYGWKVA